MEYPHIIENGQGEKLIFEGLATNEKGEYLKVSNEVAFNSGPPMHVHWIQDEWLTVVSGRIGYQLKDGPEQFAGAGETVRFNRGTWHRFWNPDQEPLICEGGVQPPNNLEYFLGNIYLSTKENGGRPAAYDSAFLLKRYKTEFDMIGIPGFVRKVIFPTALFFGNLFGKGKKFSDAPEPILK